MTNTKSTILRRELVRALRRLANELARNQIPVKSYSLSFEEDDWDEEDLWQDEPEGEGVRYVNLSFEIDNKKPSRWLNPKVWARERSNKAVGSD